MTVNIPPIVETLSTILFALAVLHTFVVKKFAELAHRAREGSIKENILHFLSEVEVVFGLWAAVLLFVWAIFIEDGDAVVHYLDSLNFTEPAFVFVIMCVSATKPIMQLARAAMGALARMIPINRGVARYVVTLVVGPLLGSAITEPAAMTVTALLLKSDLYEQQVSTRLKYITLGLLFVNISVGGTLTHFAAPPILMVARPWGWDTPFVFTAFGERAIVYIVLATILTAILFRNELTSLSHTGSNNEERAAKSPWWLTMSHLICIFLVVRYSHHMTFFISLFLLFLGWTEVTKEHQEELRLRQSMLVAFFLGGLVTLGHLQGWWLQPLITELNERTLFWGATALTSVTDNAAITYLGTLVTNLSDPAKLALVAGAVTGGGLTVIANAPNPAGYSILSTHFEEGAISPLALFLSALPYTLLAAVVMHLL